MLQKLTKWYQSILPKKWKGKTGIGFLIFMWVVPIPTWEIYWLVTGVGYEPYGLYALIGMPAFFAILTFVIGKWSLKIF